MLSGLDGWRGRCTAAFAVLLVLGGVHPRRRPSKPDTAVFSTSGSYEVSLQATVDGKGVATGRARRHGPLTAGVAIKQLRPPRDTVYGDLVLPKDASARRPAVLVFGDSEGGLDRDLHAALLAAHGYPSLALAYFKEPGLPPTLADIPLEYFISAATLLRRQPGVDPAHVFVMGVSRGGEAALLLGAYFPDKVNGVIAGVPSSSVKRGWPDTSRAAWTLHGQELQGPGAIVKTCGSRSFRRLPGWWAGRQVVRRVFR